MLHMYIYIYISLCIFLLNVVCPQSCDDVHHLADIHSAAVCWNACWSIAAASRTSPSCVKWCCLTTDHRGGIISWVNDG